MPPGGPSLALDWHAARAIEAVTIRTPRTAGVRHMLAADWHNLSKPLDMGSVPKKEN
jgi:hypothetical protein